jgi:hypothetical protein
MEMIELYTEDPVRALFLLEHTKYPIVVQLERPDGKIVARALATDSDLIEALYIDYGNHILRTFWYGYGVVKHHYVGNHTINSALLEKELQD